MIVEEGDFEKLANQVLVYEHYTLLADYGGKKLENRYILFSASGDYDYCDEVTYFILKECRSEYGWHVRITFDNWKEAIDKFDDCYTNDPENNHFFEEINPGAVKSDYRVDYCLKTEKEIYQWLLDNSIVNNEGKKKLEAFDIDNTSFKDLLQLVDNLCWGNNLRFKDDRYDFEDYYESEYEVENITRCDNNKKTFRIFPW